MLAALPAASSVAPPSFNKRRLRIVTWSSAARPPDAAAALWKEPDIVPRDTRNRSSLFGY